MNTLEITIQRKAGESWPVVAEHLQAGGLPVRVTGELQLDPSELLQQASALDYGQVLGQALFREDLRDGFARALAGSDDLLRVLLFVEDRELRPLHWERLCAPIDGQWDLLALSQRTPLSLYLPSVTDRRFPPFGRRDLRALIVAASPQDLGDKYDLEPFDVARAVEVARTALGPIPSTVLADQADVPDAVGLPTLNAIAERITAQPFTILHIVSHGQFHRRSGDTILYLSDDNYQVDAVTASRFVERLRRLRGAQGLPHLAFLSTCESAAPEAEGALGGLGQRLVRDLGMPAVVAMTERVTVESALALAQVFYQQLREHGEPDRALVEATAGLAERFDITVPALYSRLGGRPLFSDTLDRDLTDSEIAYGLEQLETLLPERAPVLQEDFLEQATILRGSLGLAIADLSPELRREREQALGEINQLSEEVLDITFNALALGKDPPSYDNRCPFQGLAAFSYENREFFFGREALVDRLQKRLAEHNFLAVLGPSGSGKSSLVLAGLIPALQDQTAGLQMAYMTPSQNPAAQLEAAVSQELLSQSQVVVVVDQFEELFTLTANPEERQLFIDRLLSLADQLPVVITMRADFWGEVAPYPKLRDAMQARQELIGPMTTAELRGAMEQQVAAVGLRFEADLSNTILDDVKDEPGAMPLLQHALLELWKRRHGRWLRAAEYRELGGVRKAIGQTADSLYEQASPEDQKRLRHIFVRLTRVDEEVVQGEEYRDTRRRANMDQLVPAGADPEATHRLLQRMADSRLVVTSVNAVTDQEEVEVAHEALIRYWPRLVGWLNEDRDALRLRQAISTEADQWDASGREESMLPRWNPRLEEALLLSQRGTIVLNDLEQSYLDAARTLRDRELAEKEAQQQRELEQARKLAEEQRLRAEAGEKAAAAAELAAAKEREAATAAELAAAKEREAAQTAERAAEKERRDARRLRRALAGVVVLFLVALAAGGLAYLQRREAEQNLLESQRNESISLVRLADDQLTVDPLKSISWSFMALPGTGTNGSAQQRPYLPEAEFMLTQGLRTHLEEGYLQALDSLGEADEIAYGEDQIALGRDGLVLVAPDSLQLDTLQQPDPTERRIDALQWSQDGSTLLSHSDSRVVLWHDGQEVARWSPDLPNDVTCAQLQPGGNQAAVCSGKQLRRWIYDEAPPVDVGRAFTKSVQGVLWSPDGASLAAWDFDGNLLIADEEGNPLRAEPAHPQPISGAAWAPSSTQVLVTVSESPTQTIRIWSLDSPNDDIVLDVDVPETYGVQFLDENRFITWELEGDAHLWSLAGERLHDFATAQGELQRIFLAPGPDQEWASTSAACAQQRTRLSSESEESDAEKSRLLAGLDRGTAVLWENLASTPVSFALEGHDKPIVSAAWYCDYLATGSIDGSVRVWDLQACQRERGRCPSFAILRGHGEGEERDRADVLGVRWQDDGRLLTYGNDGTVRTWRVFDDQGLPLCGIHDNDLLACYQYSERLTFDGQVLSEVVSARWADDDTLLFVDWVDPTQRLGRVGRWSLETGTVDGFETNQQVGDVFWSPDGAYVLLQDFSRGGKVWDVQSGASLLEIPARMEFVKWLDNELLVSWDSPEKPAELIDVVSGQSKTVPVLPDTSIQAAAGHGDRIALGLELGLLGGRLMLWNPATGDVITPEDPLPERISDLSWSPNGQQLLVSAPGTLGLWDVQQDSIDLKWEFQPPQETTSPRATFSPQDGSYLAVAFGEELFILNGSTGEAIAPTARHDDVIRGVEWLTGVQWPDQKPAPEADERLLVLTWSGDGTTRLWHWGAGSLEAPLTPTEIWRAVDLEGASPRESYSTKPIKVAAANDSGSKVLTVSDPGASGGALRVWDLWINEPDTLLKLAQSLIEPAKEERRLP